MPIYFLLILLVVLPGLITGNLFEFDKNISDRPDIKRYTNRKTRMLYCAYCGLLLFIVSAFRDFSVGTDTQSYITKYYLGAEGTSISYLLSSLNLSSVRGIIEFFQQETGFKIFNVILNDIGVSERGFIIIISIFFTYVFTRFIYKFSSNVGLSFFIHITFGVFAMSLSGIRQVIAICLVLLAFEHMKKHHIIRFLFLVGIASSVHYSAIIMFALPLLLFINPKKTISKKHVLILPAVLIVIWLIFREQLYVLIEEYAIKKYVLIGYLDSVDYNVNVLVYLFAAGLCGICILFILLRKKPVTGDDMTWLVLIVLFALLTFMSSYAYMISRLTYYFIVFFIPFLPNILAKNKQETSFIGIIGILVVGLAYFAITIPGNSLGIDNYKFGW